MHWTLKALIKNLPICDNNNLNVKCFRIKHLWNSTKLRLRYGEKMQYILDLVFIATHRMVKSLSPSLLKPKPYPTKFKSKTFLV